MEKIKQALERARQERKSAGSHQFTPAEIRRGRHQAFESPDDSNITYTKTRTVEVSLDVLRQKRIIASDSGESVSDIYKVLRTNVLQRLRANQWNTLAVTSPSEHAGKTVTAINLAISLAKLVNHTVLLVDMDLRCPNIHNYFFSERQPGISDYLLERVELSEILFNPGIKRLVILPGNKSFRNSSEMLSSPKMVQLVDELKTRYPNRIVIFDMPPLFIDDMIAFSPYIDTIMLVVEEGGTRKEDLKRAYDLLQNTNIIGTVLNKSDETSTPYGDY